MKRLLTILGAAILAGMPVLLAQQTTDLDALFARALRQETVAADPAGAITSYTEVIEIAGPTNALTPRAMLRLAECHRKLGHAQAAGIYAAIVRDYPNSGEPYDTAAMRLAAMEAQTPPSPFQATSFELPVDNWISDWTLSPDGRSVAYIRRAGSPQAPDSDLMLYDLTNGTERIVAAHLRGLGAQISFSPDGARVAAFVGNVGPAESRPYHQLLVARLDETSEPAVVVDGRASFEDALPAWSPNGRWIPYLAPSANPDLSDVRLLDLNTGASQSLGVEVYGRPDFTWFPGEERVAFRASETVGTPGAIHLVRPASMHREVVGAPADIPGQMRINSATTGGRLVLQRLDAAVTNRPGRPASATVGIFDPVDGTFTITCQGSNLIEGRRRETEDGSRDACLEVTSDGSRQLFWSAATKRLMIREIDTGVERPLTVGAAEEHFGLLSPDERVQVFVSNRDGGWGVYAAAVDQAPVSQPVKLGDLDNLPRQLTPRWSNTGLVLGAQGGSANLFRVDMNPLTGQAVGPIVRLTQDQPWNQRGVISPDGTRIAYWVSQGQAALAIMDADGANERLITPRQFGSMPYLAWLTSDDLTFVNMLPDSTQTQRLVAKLATGAVSPMNIPLFDNPAWDNPASNWDLLQPTGEIVYAWSTDPNGPFEFRALSVASGSERTVALVTATGCRLQNFAVAPDGRTLAYQLGPCSDPTKVRRIGLADLETGATRIVIEPAGLIEIGGLSAGGQFLSYTIEEADEYHPWVMNLATGDRWSLMPEPQQPELWSPLMKWAPDNSFIVFMQGGVRRTWRHWTTLSYDVVTGGGQ